MRITRIAAAPLLALALIVCLSGCTPVAPIYLGMVGGGLAFKVCQTVNVSQISVSEVQSSSSSVDGTEIWRISGERKLEAGDVIIVGDVLVGLDSVDVPFEGVQSYDHVFAIGLDTLASDRSAAPTLSASYQGNHLVSGKWLSGGDLGLVDDPC